MTQRCELHSRLPTRSLLVSSSKFCAVLARRTKLRQLNSAVQVLGSQSVAAHAGQGRPPHHRQKSSREAEQQTEEKKWGRTVIQHDRTATCGVFRSPLHVALLAKTDPEAGGRSVGIMVKKHEHLARSGKCGFCFQYSSFCWPVCSVNRADIQVNRTDIHVSFSLSA